MNYSAAQTALINAQVNSKEGSSFKIQDFLPFPMADLKVIKDLNPDVASTILRSLKVLSSKLLPIVNPLESRLIATYYWKTSAFFYK